MGWWVRHGVAAWVVVLLGVAGAATDGQALGDALTPAVESHAGRRFKAKPAVTAISRAEARRIVQAQIMARLTDEVRLTDTRAAALAPELAEAVVSEAWVLPGPDGLLALDPPPWAAALAPELQEAVWPCAVAEGLVRLLHQQHRVPPTYDRGGLVWGRQAMTQGHARFVAERVCLERGGVAAVRILRSRGGVDRLGAMSMGDPAIVARGQAYVSLLFDELGDSGLWTALAGPPPPRTLVVGELEPRLAPGWRDPTALRPPAERLWDAYSRTAEQVAVVSPMVLLTHGMSPPTPSQVAALPSTEAGLRLWVRTPERELDLYAFALTPDEDGSAWIAARTRAAHEAGHPAVDLPGVDGDGAPLFDGRLGWIHRGLWLQPDPDGVEEMWVVVDRRLVGVVGRQAGLGGPPMAQALSGLVETFPTPESTLWDPGRVVEGTASRPASHWAEALVHARDARRSRADEACLTVVAEAAAAAGPVGRRWLAQVALPCGVALKDPRRVNALLSAGGRTPGQLELVVASAYLQAGDPEAALERLAQVSAEEAATRRDQADLMLDAYLEAGHLDRAAAMARSAAASPAARWRVAHALLRQNKVEAALPVMRPICSALDPEDRGRCVELYDTLQGW